MKLVPRVLSDLFDVDSLVRISNEDLRNEIPPAVRDEPGQGVLGIEDLLVEI